VVEPGHAWCELSASTGGFEMPTVLELTFALDGQEIGTQRATRQGAFALRIPLRGVPPREHRLRVTASAFVTPHDYMGADDHRPLSYKVKALTVG